MTPAQERFYFLAVLTVVFLMFLLGIAIGRAEPCLCYADDPPTYPLPSTGDPQ